MFFDNLEVHNWRQFDSVELDLSKPCTVLTGPNGCGKTTLLTILSRHFGWTLNFIGTPYFSKRYQKRVYSDFSSMAEEALDAPPTTRPPIGAVEYSNGQVCQLTVPGNASDTAQYALSYAGQQNVRGLHIPSHRPSITFQQLTNIPTTPKTNQAQYSDFQQLLMQTYGAPRADNPGKVLKESLVSMALFGYGNEAVAANAELRVLFETFQEKLRILLPESIGFERLEVRLPDIVLVTKTQPFNLDSMSGGVNSVFAIAWQIHMYTVDKEPCTVIIDEPENHLHPSMQRTLLPNLTAAFPEHRFIIATHSPFIVASDPTANVYTLPHNADGRIVSRHLSEANLAATPDEILRDILDVPVSAPVWVEKRIDAIFLAHAGIDDPQQRAQRIYSELKRLGLVASLPQLPPQSKELQ